MPLISVILPAYNAEATIRETILSVLGQTFSDFELIVIDDGSRDRTAEVAAAIPDPRIQVFSYPNANQANSRNRGIAKATGEYLAFIDADDLWTASKLEAQFNALQAHPEAAVAYSWTDYIDQAGRRLRQGSHIAATGNVYPTLFLVNFIENGSNPLIRRQALAAIGGFDPDLPPAEDWDLWLRLAARYSFVAVPAVHILYRVSPTSMSTNVVRLERACQEVLQRAVARHPELLQPLHRTSLGNIYKYLAFQALKGEPERQRGMIASRMLWQAVHYDPKLLASRVLLKALVRAGAMFLLPPHPAQKFLGQYQTLSRMEALLGLIRADRTQLSQPIQPQMPCQPSL